ncbi:MAG TPA: M13 family metallopeptidase [Candidatus Sulfotelmatobacter sp.]|nr:M13 family metallopeptidase [Candidatus Sulfotelmatobacter sp.]
MARRSTNRIFVSTWTCLLAGSLLLVSCVLARVEAANKGGPNSAVRPGDDFYEYANSDWLAHVPLPAGQQTYDTRIMLAEKTRERVRELIQESAAAHLRARSVAQEVGDYYASFMAEAGIEAKGLAPLTAEMDTISGISNKSKLSAYLGTTLTREVDGLTANSDHVFGIWVNQGFEDAEHNLPHLWQGGLGLNERARYLDGSPQAVELRAKYRTHIAAVLKLAGFANQDTRAARIVSLETNIARSFAPDSDAADVFKQNNRWGRQDFDRKSPGIDWDAYFHSAGLAKQMKFLVWQPSAVTGVSALVGSGNIEEWKDYLRFHLIEHYAKVLPKAVRAEDFHFYGEILSGEIQAPDRAEEGIDAANGSLGEAVGQLYTQRYFSAETKQRAQAMVRDLITAYRSRIANLTWMSPSTKEKALAKLAALEIGVGYPDTWTDYSTLKIVPDDAFGNMRRAEAFYHGRDLAKLNQPVDPVEWPLNVQIPGAVIMFSPNAEFFSAAILQPPYFDSEGDSASNYGSAGAGIAHEISHSFDELGNIYDAHGRLGMWWTDEDRVRFHRETERLASQLSAYCPFPDLCLNGKKVLSESVADQAGLLVAHDAYVSSMIGKTDVVIDGLSGEQRFFRAFAQRWRRIQSDAALRKQISTDTHAPGKYRTDNVRNVDAWYEAYKVAPSDKLYLKPQARVRIW